MVLPVVLLIFTGFLYLFSVLETEVRIQSALNVICQKIASYYYAVEYAEEKTIQEEIQKEITMPVIKTALAPGIVREMTCKELGSSFFDRKIIKDGSDGLSFIGSGYDSVYQAVRVQVHYRIQLPVFSGFTFTKAISQKSVYRAWTGSDLEEATGEKYVYVTPNGTVYHTSLTCTYLNISVREVSFQTLSDLRNADGEKYTPCSVCKEENTEIVYVTTYGNKYHTNQNCSAIKREVKTIPLSEAGAMPICERCLERDGK